MDEQEQVTLLFQQQADGRKVSRLPSGKVVLIELESIARVGDGEWWLVHLRHKDSFAIATPIEKVAAPEPRPGMPPLSPKSIPVQHGAAIDERDEPGAMASVRPSSPSQAAAPARTAFEVQGMLIEPENILRPADRVALFVDGANMDGACRSAGYWIDYRRARDFFVGPGNFYAGFYYTVDVSQQDPMQLRFLDFLSYSGYIVRRKPLKRITDQDTGHDVYKGNLDTEIVLDMLNTANHYDVAFLFSGDSDFERCVDLLRSRGKRIYVVTSRRSLSRELAYVADKPVFAIEDFQDVLARQEPPGGEKLAAGL